MKPPNFHMPLTRFYKDIFEFREKFNPLFKSTDVVHFLEADLHYIESLLEKEIPYLNSQKNTRESIKIKDLKPFNLVIMDLILHHLRKGECKFHAKKSDCQSESEKCWHDPSFHDLWKLFCIFPC